MLIRFCRLLDDVKESRSAGSRLDGIGAAQRVRQVVGDRASGASHQLDAFAGRVFSVIEHGADGEERRPRVVLHCLGRIVHCIGLHHGYRPVITQVDGRRPGLGEHVPGGNVAAGVIGAPFVDHVG